MKKNYFKNLNFRLLVISGILLCIALIIHSCKKEQSTNNNSNNVDISDAKLWYETTYPNIGSAKISLESTESLNAPLNTFIKPNWNLSVSYTRFNKKVVEIPLDSAVKLGYTTNKNNFSFSKNLSKSSFLILNDGKTYTAYIMTILADSAYLQNDFTKLNHNSYSKRDNDFSGYVLYSTPEGKLLKGWHYSNGQINKTVTPTIAPTGNQQINSVQNSAIKLLDICNTQSFQILAGYSCIAAGNLSPTCTAYYNTEWVTTCSSDGGSLGASGNNGAGGSGGGDGTPDVNGFPDPSTNPPTVSTIMTIKSDSLTKHFPCASSLIVNVLSNIPAYITLTTPFTSSLKPDLVWQDGILPWNASDPNSTTKIYQTGLTTSIGRSATITLNDSSLKNSSQLLIAATAIHETLHALINFNVESATGISTGLYPATPGFNTKGSWFYSLDSWATLNGLPSNFSNHYEMLSYYFDQAVSILSTWDNGAHTLKEYQEAMLFGLDNASDGTLAQQTLLQTEFNSLLTSKVITRADLATFNQNNLNSSSNKLPITGCN